MRAIRAEGLSKRYVLAAHRDDFPTLRDALARVAARLAGRLPKAPPPEPFWALRDVSFEIGEGEIVGLIGSNGAGKSTLLKITSRVVEPTAGRVEVRGRMGSLLEVGTGFHPELTGRENVFLNGVIIGIPHREIVSKFDAIVDFAGVERFIDTPVKRYSSGMYLRLAFSVAAHLETEILLVDEVLAVGDAEFQKKCLGKMGELAGSGRTVIFTSHNMTAVQHLCTRVLHMKAGRLAADGPPREVIAGYLLAGGADRAGRRWAPPAPLQTHWLQILSASVRPAEGPAEADITVRTPFVVELDYEIREPSFAVRVEMNLKDEEGALLFSACPLDPPQSRKPGRYRERCTVPGDLMNDGRYRIDFVLNRDSSRYPFEVLDALFFHIEDVADFRHGWHGEWRGAIRPMLPWSTMRLQDEVLASVGTEP
jgi:lipopolysaccharide transport system ATP-binding protein